jgi:uncharacterized protein YlxW (UPF0749 family)
MSQSPETPPEHSAETVAPVRRRPPTGSDGAPTGRDRLRHAFRWRWSRGQAVAAVLLAVLGFAAVAQVNATDQDDVFEGARQSDLIALINTLSLATDRAEAEIAELRSTRDSLRTDAEATRTALAVARRQAEQLGILSGTLPAVGPGLRITVDARPGTVGTDQLLNGLQELRNAGAEAIEINDDVRVVAQTGITDDPEGGLVVDGVPLSTPYVLDVIGDPSTLATALEFDSGFTDEVEQVGGRVEVDELDQVEVGTTRDPAPTQFASPVDGE